MISAIAVVGIFLTAGKRVLLVGICFTGILQVYYRDKWRDLSGLTEGFNKFIRPIHSAANWIAIDHRDSQQQQPASASFGHSDRETGAARTRTSWFGLLPKDTCRGGSRIGGITDLNWSGGMPFS